MIVKVYRAGDLHFQKTTKTNLKDTAQGARSILLKAKKFKWQCSVGYAAL